MTYGMMLQLLIFSSASVFLAAGFFIWRAKRKAKKAEEQALILQEMLDYDRAYLLHLQNESLEDLPYLAEYLKGTHDTINRIIQKADYGYEGVTVSRSRQKDWKRHFHQEYKKADAETKRLLDMNCDLIDRVYRNKSPIKYRLNRFKKNILLRILYGVVAICRLLEHSSETSTYQMEEETALYNNKTLQAA